MKKLLTILLILLTTISFLFAQGQMEKADEVKYVSFTDDLGREVTLPSVVTRVAPSGSMASAFLVSFDQNLFVGVTTKPSDVEKEFFGEKFASLPILGTFYGKKANLNKEALIVANPQVVIDIGEIKGNVEDMIKDLDKLQADIGIPVIFIESYLQDIGNTYVRLGEALGYQERGNELAEFAEAAVSYANSVAKKAEQSGKKNFYYGIGYDGLNAIPTGNFHGEVLETIGGNNVVDTTISSGNNQINLEELYKLPVDNIFVLEESAYNAVVNNKEWSYLPAVKSGNVYKVPYVLFPLIDGPPAVNRIIGIYYTVSKLYPEFASENYIEKAKEFYSLFYRHELTESEIKELSR